MTKQSIERAAIAICRVMYPEAWKDGRSWEQFPESTRSAMRHAACAAWVVLSEEVRAVIANDSYAGTFQTTVQYRTALTLSFMPERVQ